MNTEREKILQKLEKLVALAGSDNEHEATLAMQRAIQIAMENNIELSQLSRDSRPTDKIEKEETGKNDARLPVTHRFIADIIQRFFNVSVVTGGSRHSGRKIWFIGKKEDIDFAKFLNSYLENTFFRLWYAYYKKNPHAKNARESYFLGLWQGLSAKLQETKNKIEQDLAENIKQGYSLMIVDNKKALDTALGEYFPALRHTKGRTIPVKSNAALNDGYEKGKQIDVNGGLTNGTVPAGFIH
jgi:type IV secretory pathway VirB4 component